MTIYQPLSRPKYFSGQLLTAEDFQAEQTYHLEKQRRHNRSLHGQGVVWGLDVSVSSRTAETAQLVRVSPGFAIDRNGDEILVPVEQQADLSPYEGSEWLWVVLCYLETPTDPLPVPGNPTEAENVAPTRITESFELALKGSLDIEDCHSAAVRLARLVRSPQGWSLDPTYRPKRLRRYDDKILWAASLLGGAAGLLVGLLLIKTK